MCVKIKIFEICSWVVLVKHFSAPPAALCDSGDTHVVQTMKFNHGHTNRYLMGKTKPPSCPACNSTITIKHIIIHCKIFTQAREEFKIPDNLYEAIRPYADTDKITFFLKKIEIYNSI